MPFIRRSHSLSVLSAFLVAAMLLISGCQGPSPGQTRPGQTRPAGSSAAPAPAVTAVQAGAKTPAEAAAQTAPAAPVQAEAAARTGSVRAAPRNLREFSPREARAALPVPADTIDLRKVFEELGPDATLWYQHVQTLANPFFEGRMPGSRGGVLAAEYMEYYFRQYGLQPAFPGETAHMGGEAVTTFTSYHQHFDFPSPRPEATVLDASLKINGEALVMDKDFVVLGVSANRALSGPVTFVGYGIAQGQDGYTSFDENTDLTGRIAMVLRYEPLNDNGKSKWSASRFSIHSTMATKLQSVADRGAAAIILVNPPGAVDGKTSLESLTDSSRFGRRLSIPAVQVTPEVATRMLSVGDEQQRDLITWRKLADRGEVKSVKLESALTVSIQTNVKVNDRISAQNVAGVLPGRGRLADEWVVIGGHYDHVGLGYTGANPANVGQVHPGADDNASGTAAVLIAAKRLAEYYERAPQHAELRSIMFIGFDGEEAGLHGSRYFVENPPMSIGAVNLMINMDMVGRLRNDSLLVQGTGTADRFDEQLRPLFESSGLRISMSPGGSGPSDHSSFYRKNVPVLFLFTGEHPDYHKPADQAYTVNPAGAAKIMKLLAQLAIHFASAPERLRFARATGAATPRDTGARVSLGTTPDYTAELETGMRVDDVRDGSSAADAGIQSGDVLLTWNGEEITGARKLGELLAKHEPGDRVTIVLRRGDAEQTVNVHLKARAAQ